jgi:hypothetical protein
MHGATIKVACYNFGTIPVIVINIILFLVKCFQYFNFILCDQSRQYIYIVCVCKFLVLSCNHFVVETQPGALYIYIYIYIYTVSQEECAKLRESVP